MRTLPHRGMPALGSVQDLVAQEMVMRERRRHVTEQSYVGRIFAAGLNLPEKLFQMWTNILSLEITQENYAPRTVRHKQEALKIMQAHRQEQTTGLTRVFKKLHKLTVDEPDLRPVTPEELERVKRRLRARRLQLSTKK